MHIINESNAPMTEVGSDVKSKMETVDFTEFIRDFRKSLQKFMKDIGQKFVEIDFKIYATMDTFVNTFVGKSMENDSKFGAFVPAITDLAKQVMKFEKD